MLIPFTDLFKRYGIVPKNILHIGANEGQELAEYYRNNSPVCVLIEAIPEVFEKLRYRTLPYPNATAVQACIGERDGEYVTFHIASNQGQSSSYLEFGTHQHLHPDVQFVNDITLKTSRMDSCLIYNGFAQTKFDFVNIDLQGAELIALKSMGLAVRDIEWLYIEVNKKETYVGCPLVEDIDRYLKTFGLVRKETSPWVGDSWGDALYGREK